jgi:hypothetical protein
VTTLEARLQRLKPHRVHRLAARPSSALAKLDEGSVRRRAGLLLDTAVYVDVLRGRANALLEAALRACDLWHSAVAIGELARGLGADDPARRGYRNDQRLTMVFAARIPAHKVLEPDHPTFELVGSRAAC